MKKLLILWAMALLACASYAQVGGPGTVVVPGGGGGGGEATSVQGSATLPGTCTELDLYQDTDSGGTELFVCTSEDSWTGVGTGTVSGSVSACPTGPAGYPLPFMTSTTSVECGYLFMSDGDLKGHDGLPVSLAAGDSIANDLAAEAGKPVSITATAAVASPVAAGAAAGGSVTITAGAAARNASGNANGGDINLVTGAGIGTGTLGQLKVTVGTEVVHGSTPTLKLYGGELGLASDGILSWGTQVNTFVSSVPDVAIKRQAAGVIACSDASSGRRCLLGGGTAVASATAMPLPTGRVFHVTGTTTITSITSTNFQSGVCVSLIFDGVLTFTDGSNLKLAGNFVTTADDAISLCYDGTNWYETGRSVN